MADRSGLAVKGMNCPLARKLGSWVRIPHEAWMSVCAFILLVLSCVYVAAFRRAHPPSKESYRLRKKDYETEE
jgi:hypothetical protein